MDHTDATVVLSLALPLLIGLGEAWMRRRGVLGWMVSAVAAFVGGIGLMYGLVVAGGLPFSESRAVTLTEVVGLVFGGLIGGAILALWLVNRLR